MSYRYMPPKGNVWGHGLRRMKPLVERDRLNDFLSRSAGTFKRTNSSLLVSGSDQNEETVYKERIAKVLKYPIEDIISNKEKMDEEEFEICLSLLDADPKLPHPKSCLIMMTESYEISEWKFGKTKEPTKSSLLVYYGNMPRIATMLNFETRQTFERVSQAFTDAGLFTLNEKHFKENK